MVAEPTGSVAEDGVRADWDEIIALNTLGDMPASEPDTARPPAWRTALIVGAAALAVAAVCLVVFGTTQKQLQIGVLLGLWGGLIAAFVAFGARRQPIDASVSVDQLAETRREAQQLHKAQLELITLHEAQLQASREAQASQEVQLRRLAEVQRLTDAPDPDLRLEVLLRRELERIMGEQLGSLRAEVAALRAEVVDKLGGQLRMERIETTRVIGSDLEALQNEIRRLTDGRDRAPVAAAAAAPTPVEAPPVEAVSAPATRSHGSHESQASHGSDIVDAEVVEPAPEAAAETESAPRPAPEPVDPPELVEQVETSEPVESVEPPTVVEPAAPVTPPAQTQRATGDPFADLPRLTPMSADVYELIRDEPAAETTPTGGSEAAETPPAYSGRRRAPEGGGGRRRAPSQD